MKKSQNREIIICEKCGGHYKLKKGESLEDFKECSCGGKLKYVESNYKTKTESEDKTITKSKLETKNAEKNKIIVPIMVAFILISGFAIYEISQGNVEEILFSLIPYDFTSHVWIPPNSASSGSLGGFYNIYGQGRDFNFIIKLPGAEKAESPLDYTQEGLNGTGRLDKIDVTYNTILALLSGNFKKAMFETKFNGNFSMTCAAWNGTGTFSSKNGTIPGTFKIDGPLTDWDGTFNIKDENRIILTMNYIYYPNGQINKAGKSSDVIYM